MKNKFLVLDAKSCTTSSICWRLAQFSSRLGADDDMLNIADSSNVGDDLEIIALFRALTAHTELNFPCLPIRQVII